MQVHLVLEGDVGDGRIALLANDVRSDVAVPDGHGRVVEDLRVADMVLMIVTEHEELYRHIVALGELGLEPIHRP